MTAEVGEEQASRWDTPATLYRAFDEAGGLLYVGITSNIKRRLQQHAVDSPWWDAHRRIETEDYPTRGEAMFAEDVAIWREHPRWNRVHARSTKPLPVAPTSTEGRLARLDELTAVLRAAEERLTEGKAVVEELLRSGVPVREMAMAGVWSAQTLRTIRSSLRKREEIPAARAEGAGSDRRLAELREVRRAADEAHREAGELVRSLLLAQSVKARELINRPFSEAWVRAVRAEMKRRGEIA